MLVLLGTETSLSSLPSSSAVSIMRSRLAFSVAPRRKLSAGLCEVVQDFGLVSFVPLAIQVGRGTLPAAKLAQGMHHADASLHAVLLGSLCRTCFEACHMPMHLHMHLHNMVRRTRRQWPTCLG